MATPILVPSWRVTCTRCEEDVRVPCQCPPLEAGDLAESPEDAGALLAVTGASGYPMHEHGCIPTYRSDGGALPDQCPRCKQRNWLEPRRYRQGHGVSKSAEWRRKRKTA